MENKSSVSYVAMAAPIVGLLGVVGLIGGPLLARLGVVPPILGFLLFAAGALLGGVLALILGGIGVFRTRASAHRSGASQAWAGVVLGAVLLAVVFLLAPGGEVPAIHDLTTDLEDPPEFVAVLEAAGASAEDWSYPHGLPETAELQRAAYPDLEPIEIDADPAAALERARAAAEELGWEIVDVDPEAGRLEASDTSSVFRFVDDVVIRVREGEAGGSRIDVRSKSRVGQSDLGANAERIRAFRDQLTEG